MAVLMLTFSFKAVIYSLKSLTHALSLSTGIFQRNITKNEVTKMSQSAGESFESFGVISDFQKPLTPSLSKLTK